MDRQHDTAFLKRRKLLLVLPLLVLPFITMAFWALGGGKGKQDGTVSVSKGLNLLLPDADVADRKPQDNMSLYDQAQKDSLDLVKRKFLLADSLARGLKTDPNELAIQAKLAQINAQVNAVPTSPNSVTGAGVKQSALESKDVAKLEALMKNMKGSGGEDDPEMRNLNAMMDKILAIQNPDLVRQQQHLSNAASRPDSLFSAIPVVVAATMKAVEGSVIELRLLDTVVLGGQLIPKGHAVFGIASFSNQRIFMEIKNVRLGNRIIPVNLTVFDQRDGMAGIHAPEALLTGAVNSGADDALRSIQLMGMEQGLGGQVAGAGIQAAKGLLSKTVRRAKQKLEKGYPLLLRDNAKRSRQN